MKRWKKWNILVLILCMIMTAILPAALSETALAAEEKETTVTATVPASTNSYYISIPETIDLGELDGTEDYAKTYQIDVSGTSQAGTKVKVSTPEKGEFQLNTKQRSAATLPYTNDYGTQIFDVGTITYGTLRVAKEEIAKAPSGSYSGNVIFTVSEVTDKDENDSGNESDGNKEIETTVNLMQYTDIKQKSMCDPLFYSKVTLKTSGDGNVDVEMYLIDPIPGFASSDPVTPLSQLYFTGSANDLNFPEDDRDANASIHLNPAEGSFAVQAKIDQSSSYDKEYEAYSIYILKNGLYPSRKVTFTIPLSAVQNSTAGSVVATAYVDAVMNVWKQFYLVFGDVSGLTGNNSGDTNPDDNNGSGNSGNNGNNGNSGTGSDSGSGNTSGGTTDLKTQTKYSASVSIRKSTNINSVSMCNPLFYSKADMTVNGDMTTLTMYVIDPIPNYPGEGTPLSNIVFQAGGSSYTASLDTTNKVSRAYGPASGFISQAGNYYSDPITVTIPTNAVKNSGSGSILCSAYVSAVMKSTQKFYVVLSDFVEGESTASSGPATEITGETNETGTGLGSTASGDKIALGESVENLEKDGDYTSDISMRKSTDIKEKSMCNPLFYERADLSVKGEETDVTIYLINPIPQYAEEGTPLSDIVVKIDGKEYEASLEEENPVSRYFEAASGFIPEAGYYDTASIHVKLPTDAIEKSQDGTILCSAYINAVMKTTQEFYVVFTDFRTGTTSDVKEEAIGENSASETAEMDKQVANQKTYQLVTDAGWLGILLILLTLGGAGTAVRIWRKKQRIGWRQS